MACAKVLPSTAVKVGPVTTGILAAGQYRSKSPFKLYFFDWEDDKPEAFLSDWSEKWPLKVTGNKGWRVERETQPDGRSASGP